MFFSCITLTQANVDKFEQALDKVNEAFSSISDYHGEIAALNPQHQKAKQRTEQILEEVHECEQIFADVSEFSWAIYMYYVNTCTKAPHTPDGNKLSLN